MRVWIAIGCLAICTLGARAQLLDSLQLFRKEPGKFVVKLDSRGSFISNQQVRLLGVKVGVEHAGRLQYGIGYSFLSSPIQRMVAVDDQGMKEVRLSMGYVTPYVEYAFYQRGNWEARIPVQVGFGGAALSYRDEADDKHKIDRAFIFLYEPSMTIQYRFLKYFGVNAGWGYRLVFSGADLGEQLTAPIYLYGFKVFFGDLWNDIR